MDVRGYCIFLWWESSKLWPFLTASALPAPRFSPPLRITLSPAFRPLHALRDQHVEGKPRCVLSPSWWTSSNWYFTLCVFLEWANRAQNPALCACLEPLNLFPDALGKHTIGADGSPIHIAANARTWSKQEAHSHHKPTEVLVLVDSSGKQL